MGKKGSGGAGYLPKLRFPIGYWLPKRCSKIRKLLSCYCWLYCLSAWLAGAVYFQEKKILKKASKSAKPFRCCYFASFLLASVVESHDFHVILLSARLLRIASACWNVAHAQKKNRHKLRANALSSGGERELVLTNCQQKSHLAILFFINFILNFFCHLIKFKSQLEKVFFF